MERLEYLEKATELLDKGWRMWMWLYANPGNRKEAYFTENNIKNDAGMCFCYACGVICLFKAVTCLNCELDWEDKHEHTLCTNTGTPYVRWAESNYTDTQAAFEVAELFRTARDRLLSEKAELLREAGK